jgi:hypothetical protein
VRNRFTVTIHDAEFNRALHHWAAKTNQGIENATAQLATEAFRNIQLRTPVDTGNAKKSWRMRKLGRLTWIIQTAVDYMIHLEYGHSKQAPGGMVRITIDELRDAVLKIYRAAQTWKFP